MHKLLCTQFLHGYTVFSMQEQVPFSMPMEYHHGLFLVFSMQEQVLIEVLFSMNIITDFFFSFFYARTGALLFANGILSSRTFFYK